MNNELVYALAGFALVSSITPGPNNLMLMASGTNFGFRRSIPHALGVSLGFVLMIIVVGLGLMQVFEAYPLSNHILKVVSVVYLLYLSWKIATAAGPHEADAANGAGRKPFTFIQAALFQWVNPKAWAMALTGISAYTPAGHPIDSILIVGLVFCIVNLPSVSVWVVLGTQLRRFLRDRKKLRLFNISAALLLIATLYPILF